MELLKMHSDEVRFQIQLNWDRAKSSLAYHAALLALVAGLEKKFLAPTFTVAALFFIAVSAMFCAGILTVSHGYYRAARDRRRQVEAALSVAVPFGTTATMRGDPQPGLLKYWPKVNNILVLLHVLLALLAGCGAYLYWVQQQGA